MSRLLPLLCVLVLGLLATACGEDEETPAAAPTATPTPADEAAEAGCRTVDAPEPKEDGGRRRPSLELSASRTYIAVVTTSCGAFEITLDAEEAPKTGGSFVALARDGFFDDLVFHRIVAGFVIQGGDPTGTGTGGPGYSVVEAPPEDAAYTKGVVAMAKTATEAPGTSGSQFYVVTGEDAGLPPEYALLGEVTRGLDVVETIGAAPTGADERPVAPVVIERVEIRES